MSRDAWVIEVTTVLRALLETRDLLEPQEPQAYPDLLQTRGLQDLQDQPDILEPQVCQDLPLTQVLQDLQEQLGILDLLAYLGLL